MKDYCKIGESKCIDGKWWFKPDYTPNGYIFKDEEAYLNDWNKPCYVSELAFEDCERDEEGWYQCDDWDNHWMILEYAARNTLWADTAFDQNDWMYMSTWIEDGVFNFCPDDSYFYSFVVEGVKVWWEDPEGESSGVYKVCKTPPIEDFDYDTIVLLSNGVSEVEALLCELGDYLHPLP